MRSFLLKLLLSGVLISLGFSSAARSAEETAPDAAIEPAPPNMISLNLTGDVDLRAFVDYVSKRTGRKFLYSDRTFPPRKVTLLIPKQIPEDGLFALLESILEYEGLALVPTADGLIKIVQQGVAMKKPTPLFLPGDLDSLPNTDTLLTLAYKVEHVGANEVVAAITPLVQGGVGVIQRSNILIITDYGHNLHRIVNLIRIIDDENNVPQLKIYDLEFASAQTLAEQIGRIIQAESAAIGAAKGQQPTVEFDATTNTLIALATPVGIKKIDFLVERLDARPEEGNIRFYRLKNAKAVDVAGTLTDLVQQRPSGVRAVPGARQPQPGATAGTLGQADVRLIGDEGTNSIIVVGPPDVQLEIAALIEELDRRKPQVLIEALVVQVTAGSDLDVGVDLASWGADNGDGGIGVTSFGLSTYDYDTGTRTILDSLGGTAALVKNDQIPILLRALLIDNNGQVISRPRILANDNAKAAFNSVEKQPYTSINTVTSTVATTSFGGDYAEAGTKFTVIPQISEGDYLSLEIEFEISRFTAAASTAEVPPPQRSDTVTTAVTVPDDYTVVIGGLSGYNLTETVNKVPILGDIPLLGALFRRTVTSRDDTTEYIFIKAQIARDEGFEDLKEMSREAKEKSRQLEIAGTGENAPENLFDGQEEPAPQPDDMPQE